MISRRSLLAAPAALAGCNRQTKRKIGVVPKGRAHVFWQSVHAGAEKAARETGIEIVWNGPTTETDYAAQLQIIDSMITQRLDAIVLAPIDKTAMVSAVERAAKQNIPVIIFDSGIDTQNYVSMVATDNYAAGQAGAERLAKITGGKGKIVMVMVQPGGASTMAREQGFLDKIKEYPGIVVADKRYGMADFAKSRDVSENMLTAHPDLVAMFASNESSTVGAVQALKGRQSKVKLVGFDSSPNLIADLRSGVIDSLVVQDPFRMGYDSVKAAVAKLAGETPAKDQPLPPLVVTKENLDDPKVAAQLNPPLAEFLK